MATGISARDYVRWVQRSLNRLFGAGLIVDGATSAEYYEWVTEFKWSRRLPANNVMDEAAQNELIKANHKDPMYVLWVQEALVKSAAGYELKVDGAFGPNTKACLQSFQAYMGLVDDGWMGAKTETKLIEVTGLYPPGEKRGDAPKPVPVPPKPPEPDWVDPMNLDRRFEFWCWAYRSKLEKATRIDEKQKKTLICMLNKLRLNRGWFDYIEGPKAREYVNTNNLNGTYPSEHTVDARRILKATTDQIRSKARSEKQGFQDWQTAFMDWYTKRFEFGLAEISRLESTNGYEIKSKLLSRWRNDQQKDPRSIIWCYFKFQGSSWW